MKAIDIDIDENQIQSIIKSLLSLEDDGALVYHSMSTLISLKFRGNCHNVQKEIYNWLSLPERKENFEALSDDGGN